MKQQIERVLLLTVTCLAICLSCAEPVSEAAQAISCRSEFENANRKMSEWAGQIQEIMNDSQLPAQMRESLKNEVNKVLHMIKDFGKQIKTKQPSLLAKNLLTIIRRLNLMAIGIYVNTFDIRWFNMVLHVGVTVERVSQACPETIN